MDSSATRTATLFRDYACTKLQEYAAQITRCVRLLSDEQAWHRVNEHCNSVGNLLLHLRGNVTQWIVSGIGGRPFERDRPAEFAQRAALPTEPLISALNHAIRQACEIIKAQADARLAEPVNIQGYDTTVLAAIFHVVEHFAFHTGQIVTMTKQIRDVDLSLYDAQGHRLDQRAHGIP